jgi:subtilisin family serine protease
VTVAVIDSGVDASHPDLAGQVLPGADFITGTEGTSVDPHGHGTHVAGTIAALTGNGIGVAGAAPDARILPVRVLGANGSGYMSDVANGIAYAADHGAGVINLSISSTTQVGAVSNAVAYARSKGVVIVAAAGNARRSGSPTSFPAADTGVIAVAATTSDDSVAAYSNRGGYVDVAAPGSDILSTYPGNRYGRMSGTSMAAPHVAAVAAILKDAGHDITPDQVEQALTTSAVDLGEPGRDDDFGAGRIDAAAALALRTPPSTGPATTEPAMPATSAPAETATPTQAATPEPTTQPTTPTPSTPPTPSTTPTPEPSTTPTPSTPPSPEPSRTTPTPSQPAPPTTPAVGVFRTGPGLLIVVTAGADGEQAQIQRWTGGAWETVRTFPAAKISRFSGLTPGLNHRVVVSGTTSSVILL